VGEISVPIVKAYDRTSGIHLMAIHCAAVEGGVLIKNNERLENVAIANVLQLQAVWSTPAPSRFNYHACQVWSR